MDRLVSKIIAGGLSAGVFLFWWPDHVTGEGLLQFVLRGLLWTLTFELLLLTLGPAETRIERRIRARSSGRSERVRNRLAGVPAPARTGGVVALACCGLAAPLALIADAPSQLVKQTEQPRVVKQVIVERPVVEKKVIVRKVVAPAEPLQSAGAAPSVSASQVTRRPARTATVAPERTSDAKRAATEDVAQAVRKVTSTTSDAKQVTELKSAPATKTAAAGEIGTPADGAQSGVSAPAPAPAPPAS